MMRFPMIACHWAMLHARRTLLGVMAFVLLLVCLAMGYAGMFDTMAALVSSGWILMLVVCYGLLYLFIADDSGRDAYFKALGLYRLWCWTQAVVHFFIMLPLIILLGIILFFAVGAGGLGMAGMMLLFEAVFAEATMVSLQPRFVGLSKSKKLALMGVISSPWILTAWLLGLFATKSLLYGDSVWAFVIGLAMLGGIQTALSFYYET